MWVTVRILIIFIIIHILIFESVDHSLESCPGWDYFLEFFLFSLLRSKILRFSRSMLQVILDFLICAISLNCNSVFTVTFHESWLYFIGILLRQLLILQTEDEDMVYMYNAYLHKLITCFLSNPLARDKVDWFFCSYIWNKLIWLIECTNFARIFFGSQTTWWMLTTVFKPLISSLIIAVESWNYCLTCHVCRFLLFLTSLFIFACSLYLFIYSLYFGCIFV